MTRMGSVSKPVLKRMTDVMPFGKYKGETVRWILDHEASYLLWLRDEKIADVSDKIYEEAERIDDAERWDDADSNFHWEDWGDLNN